MLETYSTAGIRHDFNTIFVLCIDLLFIIRNKSDVVEIIQWLTTTERNFLIAF